MNKKGNQLLLAVIAGCVLIACSSSKETASSGVWVNKEKIQGKSVRKVFIVVMTADIEARSVVENDLARAAVAEGFEAVKSIDVMPPSLQDPKTPPKDELVKKVKESGCDAVLIASLLRKEEDVRHTSGTTAYAVRPYYSYYGGYYSQWYPTVSTPDYYSKEKTYFMQSNLYETASEEIMWSIQSKIFNPSSLQKFSKTYTAELVKNLKEEHIMKNKKDR